jgi:hypothetical protein
MTLQKRLKRVMKRRGWRVADLARALDRPYTTTREWVLFGRDPGDPAIERKLVKLEG